MFIHVAVIVLLFLARVRFPKSKSIAEVIRSRYIENTLKRIRKLEKLDYRLRKTELDVQFLCKCDDNNVIPNFLNFRLANSGLKYSSTYRLCQLNLLREEIRQERSTLRSLQKEFSSPKVSLQNELNCAHVSTLFFKINDKILQSKSSVQQKKFYRLLQKSQIENDPEKVIFNFSKYVLSHTEKKLLAKGLNFCLPPKQLKYADYLVHFELLYRDIRNLEILSNEDLDFVKTKTALSSFRQCNKNPKQNLSKEELAALTNLSKNKDIVIQKADKGNSVVIVDKDTYIKRMENLLSDQRKFEKVTLKNDAFLNFVVNQKKRIDTIFKNLVDSNSMSKEMRKFVKPVGTRPGIMYGNCKVHKQQVDSCLPFRPMLSALQTPTYNLDKFLVPILNPLTKNEYIVRDSFQFAEEICEQDPTLTMGSLDVDSLFTNIPLDETIDICINQLFENTDTVEGSKKSELKQLLCLATKESYFIFNGLLYKQVDSVAMGSPLGPSLANAFLSYYEKNLVKQLSARI